MTRVKICGLKDGLDLEGALQAGQMQWDSL